MRLPLGKPWFRPKAFGYGAGLPITWQGWAVVLAFCGAAAAAARLIQPGWRLVTAEGALLVLVVGVAALKTEGGVWRWRP